MQAETDVTQTHLERVVARMEPRARPEMVNVPETAKEVAIVRWQSTPELAFLVWTHGRTDRRTQIHFKLENGRNSEEFEVVCVCANRDCCPELSGVTGNRRVDDEKLKRGRFSPQAFKRRLQKLCKQLGVKVLLVRKANNWEGHYGDSMKGIDVFEAEDHDKLMRLRYEQLRSSDLPFSLHLRTSWWNLFA